MKFNIRRAWTLATHTYPCRLQKRAGIARIFVSLGFLFLCSSMAHAQSVTTISALPYEIKASGTYVLAGDLTLDENVSAIAIQASNVTLDCRGYRVTSATRYPDIVAIYAVVGQSDVGIKNCTIVNFDRGITAGWGGYRTQILDNQVLDGGARGITILGSDALVSGNRVIGLRGKPGGTSEGIALREFDTGILSVNVRVLDNVVANIFGDNGARGIFVGQSSAPEIAGNTILDVRTNPAYYYYSYYIHFPEYVTGPFVENALIRQNVMMSRMLPAEYVSDRAYAGQPNVAAACRDNVSVGFRVIDYSTCQILERNVDIE